MNNRFNEAIYEVGVLGDKQGANVKEIQVMLELGRLCYELQKTIDTYKRVAIKEEIKKLEGIEE